MSYGTLTQACNTQQLMLGLFLPVAQISALVQHVMWLSGCIQILAPSLCAVSNAPRVLCTQLMSWYLSSIWYLDVQNKLQ